MTYAKFAILLVLLFVGCAPTYRPLCKHVVLSHYAAARDQGAEAELWFMKNTKPGPFKYHVACRRKFGDSWYWVDQPPTVYTTSATPPKNTMLIRKMSFNEVVNMSRHTEESK